MTYKRSSWIILVIAWFGVCAVLPLLLVNSLFPDETWTREKLNRLFNSPIPDEASALSVEGFTGRGGTNLNLSFSAPSDTAIIFASQFCGGVLFPGYDPFDAIDTHSQSQIHSYAITLGDPPNTYYSYSPKAPETTSGNRCGGTSPIQIRIDQANPLRSNIRVELRSNCSEICYH